jgi:hypothetical protein
VLFELSYYNKSSKNFFKFSDFTRQLPALLIEVQTKQSVGGDWLCQKQHQHHKFFISLIYVNGSYRLLVCLR